MRQEDFYHIGMIVENFDGAIDLYTRETGACWSPVIHVDLRAWTRDHGVVNIRPKAVYSTKYPHMEIVEAIPGTALVVRAGRPVHHLGFWTDDLHGDVAAMEAEGWSKILCPDDRGRMFGMAYMESVDGQLIELVERTSFPDWEGFLAGRMQHEVIV